MKENILNAWIMVENFSEGNFEKNNKETIKFIVNENDIDIDYYTMISEKIEAKKKYKNFSNKGGFLIYLGCFEFKEVLAKMREKNNLSETEEELNLGDKFSVVLFFQNDFKLIPEKTFVNKNYYILLKKGELPKRDDFKKFEDEIKNDIASIFNLEFNPEKEINLESFNKFLKQLFEKYNFSSKEAYFKLTSNIETENIYLHSFFIDDLEEAIRIKNENLDKYILGVESERVDLNTKNIKNPAIFKELLQPKNYPLGRFPSNPEYSLSFMQQIAVNIATTQEEKIISVNGPPGTGKTTLLKDVFAHNIIEQAFEICNLSDKSIKGDDTTKYEFNNREYTLGKMPVEISKYGMVLASSNNGALQNIVNELPLLKEIDDSFKEELKEVDYFIEISNSNKEDKEKEKWGMFSIEGGKKQNQDKIKDVLNDIYNSFKDKETDEKIYEEFLREYKNLEKYRSEIQKIYENIEENENEILKIVPEGNNNLVEFKNNLEDEINKLVNEENDESNNLKILNVNEEILNRKIEVVKSNKPSWLYYIFSKEKVDEYNKNKQNIENELSKLLDEKMSIVMKLSKINNEIKIKENKVKKLRELEEKSKELDNELNKKGIKKLDLNLNYDELQKSNPWFNKEYRENQSRLFILALKVRKNFLIKNKHHLLGSINIWNSERSEILYREAWNWINFTIPIISSTFASFRRMFNKLGENSIANLFVDEAGQVLPYASVGAIFRSKKIMVVGDPFQIPPVLTLDSKILAFIAESFCISEKYLSLNTSTQSMVDAVSKYGFYKGFDEDTKEWIGVPLWVHRRCKDPMFNVSNAISYDGNMVQGNPGEGKIEWYNVKGQATNKYVKEHGEKLKELIDDILKKDETKQDNNSIYVITPFANVAAELKKIDFKSEKVEIGTVHTFQGKEAKIVFFVLGADENSKGAATWAVGSQNPNIMNVAVTRAKEEFYIIGDKELYSKLNSKVIDKTLKIINKKLT